MKEFQTETDFNKYIRAIAREEYLIILAVKDTIGGKVGTEGYASLRELGIKMLGSKEDGSYDHWKGYVAILYRGILQYENLEELDMTVEYETFIDGVKLEICSSPLRSANRASIIVNGEEYAVNCRGINVVVVDTQNSSVIDSVAFDTWADGRPCFRNERKREIVLIPNNRNEINLLRVNEARERLKLSNIIKDFSNYKKIKIRIFQWGSYQLWSAMESVAVEFAQDDKYELMVIVDKPGEEGDKLIEIMASHGIKAIRGKDYSVRKDSPEIAVFQYQSSFGLADCESVKLRYLVPTTLINGIVYSEESTVAELLMSQNYKYKINRIFVDNNLFGKLDERQSIDITELSGNPKFDIIYNKTKTNTEFPKEWKKLKGKKIFLWAFDHNWWLKSSSSDLYFKELIQFTLKNEKIGLIIRPHVEFLNEMIRHGIWTRDDIDAMICFCDTTSNIIWDNMIDYGYAYRVADAIMTDVNCGIVISALPLDKPVAVLQRFDGNICKPQYPDIVANHYNINSIEELHSFFEMVKEGKDPKKNQRKEMCQKYVAHFDGLNGRRIKESIERDIQNLGLRRW